MAVSFFVHQKLNSSLFKELQYGWEWLIHFELNTKQTTMFTKLYLTVNWSSRNNEQVGTSTMSGSHCLLEILGQRHYFPKVQLSITIPCIDIS